MAELEVQPKKKSPIIWILLFIAILAVLFILLRGCNDKASNAKKTGTDSTSILASTVADWDSVDFDVPVASYDEVTDKGIEIRGNDKYTIYGLGENILFSTDRSNIQESADEQLKQISASLKKRFDGASIAVYGNTDASGTAGHNKELGAERAEAVKNWLVENGGIPAHKISVHSRGESAAVATNATGEGKQLNRNVQIVALAK